MAFKQKIIYAKNFNAILFFVIFSLCSCNFVLVFCATNNNEQQQRFSAATTTTTITTKVNTPTQQQTLNVPLIDCNNSLTLANDNSSRTPRLIKIFNKHINGYNHNNNNHLRRNHRLPPTAVKILSRADHYLPSLPTLVSQHLPAIHQRQPFVNGPRAQIVRRVTNNLALPASQANNYQSAAAAVAAAAAPTRQLNYDVNKYNRFNKNNQFGGAGNGKSSVYRPQQFSANNLHPNSVAAPIQQTHNFKASPTYNGKAIVRPTIVDTQKSKEIILHEVAQYPIPQQQKYYNEREQQQAYQQQQRPTNYYQSPSKTIEEPILKPHLKYEHAHSSVYTKAPTQMYSVHEELHGDRPHNYNAHNEQNYQSNSVNAKQAEEYMKFMNSNDYFLPKRDPNYKQIDEDKDRLQYFQQKQQQQQYMASKSLADAYAASSDNNPIQISKLFYQQDPLSVSGSGVGVNGAGAGLSSAVVRGSYQTDNNLFIVNSDGNKAVKHIVPPPAMKTTTQAPSYAQVRYSNNIKSLTPDPLRFEFTERDAVAATYTNSPKSKGSQLRYKTVHHLAATSTPRTGGYASSTTVTPTRATTKPVREIFKIKPVHEIEDDPEDNEDMQEASSDIYGRIPARLPNNDVRRDDEPSQPSASAPVEQKDNEDYCEKMCAVVIDDDDEVVCGSDGYMYTSEAQLECYASCLHIDITIQRSGSCNAS